MDNRQAAENKNGETVSNKDFEGVDKAPGEERGKGEQVKTEDLKGKKVDADPEAPFEQPIRQLP